MPLIQGKAMWAKVQKADQYGNYCIDVVIDEKGAKQLQNDNLGHAVKTNDNGELVAKFKRKAITGDGKPAPGPIVIDAAGQEFHDLIGNGSTVNVQYHAQKYTKPKPGFKAVLDGVQIIDLVPFGTPVSEFTKVAGYSQETEANIEEAFL